MNYLGIDPGKSGACALIDESGVLRYWFRAPVINKEYDGLVMQEIIAGFQRKYRDNLQAFIEFQNAGAYSGMKIGATSIFQMGLGFGRWLQALESNEVPYRTVAPAVWMKAHATTPKVTGKARKAHHILTAKKMFPHPAVWNLSKVIQEAVAEAALIANWGKAQNG